jgi:hypothetical protein
VTTDAEAGITEQMRKDQHDLVFKPSKNLPRRFRQSNTTTQAPPIPRKVNR